MFRINIFLEIFIIISCKIVGTMMVLLFQNQLVTLPTNQQNNIVVGTNWITVNDLTINSIETKEFIKKMEVCLK